MKFCYIDESGVGTEITVVAGVVVDAIRMRRAKMDWDAFLDEIRFNLGGNLPELKGRSLYRGNEEWRRLDGGERTKFIERIIEWMIDKKHVVTFGAVSRSRLEKIRQTFVLDGFEDATSWSIAAMHVVLGVQKHYQGQRNNKGNTAFVFDKASGADEITQLVLNPPGATGTFYKQRKGQEPLDQVIDVPYFADSRHVGLIQVADLFAFLLRLYAELHEGVTEEKFSGETDRLAGWIQQMGPCLMRDSARWSTTAKDPCTEFFRAAAPLALLRIAR